MTERLEDQIRRYTGALDAEARAAEELVPAAMAEKLGIDRSTIEITLPLTPPRPQQRVPGWAWGIAAAAVVVLLTLPVLVWLGSSGADVVDTIATTTSHVEDEGLVQYPTNGHRYEAVTVPRGIPWEEARTAAASRSFGGVQGHLATFTSADEYAFVVANLSELSALAPDDNPHWLGGFQPPQSPNEPSGDWQWVTGEPFVYTNWAPGEPNDSVEGEDCLHPLRPPPDSPRWNDQPCDDDTVRGYIVEYDTSG